MLRLFFLICISFNVQLSYANSLEVEVRMVYLKYGVEVHYQYDREAFFPRSWLNSDIDAEGEAITEYEAQRVLRQINIFLASFPGSFIKQNLKNIYMMHDMTFYGKSFGKTYNRNSLYIESQGLEAGYTDDFILKGLYHEFSSIVMHNYNFPVGDWNRANITGFSYSGSGKEILGETDLNGLNQELLVQGFLSKYSTSSLENDFNVLSEWIFTNREELDRLSGKYPGIARKFVIAKHFYNNITMQNLIH